MNKKFENFLCILNFWGSEVPFIYVSRTSGKTGLWPSPALRCSASKGMISNVKSNKIQDLSLQTIIFKHLLLSI